MAKFLTKIPDKILRKSQLPPKPKKNFDLKMLHLIPEDNASGIPTRKASILTIQPSRSRTPTPTLRHHKPPAYQTLLSVPIKSKITEIPEHTYKP